MAECLRDAIEHNLDGFQAGTTKDERMVMARHFHVQVRPLVDLVPEEPKKRRVYRKIVTEIQDTLTYLDGLQGPDPLGSYGL